MDADDLYHMNQQIQQEDAERYIESFAPYHND